MLLYNFFSLCSIESLSLTSSVLPLGLVFPLKQLCVWKWVTCWPHTSVILLQQPGLLFWLKCSMCACVCVCRTITLCLQRNLDFFPNFLFSLFVDIVCASSVGLQILDHSGMMFDSFLNQNTDKDTKRLLSKGDKNLKNSYNHGNIYCHSHSHDMILIS